MEEDERTQKLKAGKDKLAQFQKRRKKKKRRDNHEAWPPLEAGVGDTADAAAVTLMPSDASSYDSDQMSFSSVSEDDGETEESTSRYIVQARYQLREKSARIEELEESLTCKQLALDKVIRENDNLRQCAATGNDKASDSNMNMVLLEEGQSCSETTTAENQACVQAGSQSDTTVEGTSPSDVLELTQHIQWLQTQLKQTNSTLHLQADRQSDTVRALQDAKMEVLSLRDNLVEKDELVTQLAEKLTLISTEYGALKENYSKLTKHQVAINECADTEAQDEHITDLKLETAQQEQMSDIKPVEAKCNANADYTNALVINLTEELKLVKDDCHNLTLENNSLKENADVASELKIEKCKNLELENEILLLKDAEENSRAEIIKLAKEVINVKEKKVETEKEIDSLLYKLNISKSDKEMLTSENLFLTDQIMEFKQMNEQLVEEMNSLTEQTEGERIKNEKLEISNGILSEELAAKQHELESALSQILAHETEAANNDESQEREFGDLMEENRSLRTQNDELYNKINKQKDVMAEQSSDIDTVTCENLQQNDQIKAFTASLEEYRDVIGDWQKENEELQAEVSDLKSALKLSRKENMQYKEKIAFLDLDIEHLKEDLGNSKLECNICKTKLVDFENQSQSENVGMDVIGENTRQMSPYEVVPDVDVQYTVITPDTALPSQSACSIDKSSSITVLDSEKVAETLSDMSVLQEEQSNTALDIDENNEPQWQDHGEIFMSDSNCLPILDSEKLPLISSLNRSENSVDISSSIAIIDSETSAELLFEHQIPIQQTSDKTKSNVTELVQDVENFSRNPFTFSDEQNEPQLLTIVPPEDKDLIISNLQHEIENLKSLLCKYRSESNVAETPSNTNDIIRPAKSVSTDTQSCHFDKSPNDTRISSEGHEICETTNDTAYTTLDFSKSDENQTIYELQDEITVLRNRLETLQQENLQMKAEAQIDQTGGVSADQCILPDEKLQADTPKEDSTYQSRKVSDVDLHAASGMEVNLHASSSQSCHGSFSLVPFVPGVTVDNFVIVEDDTFQNPEEVTDTFTDKFTQTEIKSSDSLHYGELLQLKEELEEAKTKVVRFYEQQQNSREKEEQQELTIEQLQQIVKACQTEKQNAVECKCRLEELNKKLSKDIENYIVMYGNAQYDIGALSKAMQQSKVELKNVSHENELLTIAMQQSKDELKNIKHENELITWQKNELEIKLTSLDQEVLEVKTAKCDLESKSDLIKDELETVRDRLEYLESSARDCFEMKEIVDSIQEQKDEICIENENLHGQLSLQSEENQALLDTFDVIYKENADLLESINSQKMEYQNLQSQYHSSKKQNEKLQNFLKEVQKDNEIECSKFIGEIDGLLQESSTLKTQIKTRDAEIDHLEEENKRLQGYFPNIDAYGEEIGILKQRIMERERLVQDVSIDRDKYIQELTESQLKIVDIESENSAIFEKYRDQQDILEQMEDEKTFMLEQIETLKTQMKHMESEKLVTVDRLNCQLEGLDQENSTLKTKIKSLKSDFQEVIDQSQLLEEKCAEKTERVRVLDEDNIVLKAENTEYKGKVTELEKELVEFAQQVQQYHDTLSEKVVVSSRLEEEINTLFEENSTLKMKIASLEHDLIDSNDREGHLNSQVKTYEESLKYSKTKLVEYDMLISELEHKNSELKVDFDESQTKLESNRSEIQNLNYKSEEVRLEYEKLEKATVEDKEIYKKMQCDLITAQEEIRYLQTQSADMESEFKDRINSENSELKDLVRSVQDENEKLKCDIEKLSESCKMVTTMLHESETCMKKTAADYNEITDMLTSVQDENKKLKCNIEANLVSSNKVTSVLHELEMSNARINDENNELRNLIELVQDENKKLKCEIETTSELCSTMTTKLHESESSRKFIDSEKCEINNLLISVHDENAKLKHDLESFTESSEKMLHEANVSMDRMNVENLELRDLLKSVQNENDKLTYDLEVALESSNKATTMLHESESRNKKISAENMELSNVLQSLQHENKKLKCDIDTISETSNMVTAMLHESESSLANVNVEKSELREVLVLVQDENKKLKFDIETTTESSKTVNAMLHEADISRKKMNLENNELRDLLESFQYENKKLKCDIETVSDSSKAVTAMLHEAESSREKVNDENNELRDLLGLAQDESKKLKCDLETVSDSSEQVATMLHQAESSKENIIAENRELKELLVLVQNENEKLMCDIDSNNSRKFELINCSEKMQDEHKTSDIKTLATLCKETVVSEKCELMDLLRTSRDKNKRLLSDMEKISISVDNMAARLNDSELRNSKMNSENCELRDLIESVENENKKLEIENAEMKMSHESATEKWRNLESESIKLNEFLVSVQERIKMAEDIIEDKISLENRNTILNDKIEGLCLQVEHIKNERETLEKLTTDLTSMLHDMQTKYEVVKSEMETTKKKCDKDIGLLQTQLQTMNKDVQDLRQLLDLMENEMYSASEEKTVLKDHLEQRQAQYDDAVEQKQKLEEMLSEKHQKDLKNQRKLSQQINQRSDLNSRIPEDINNYDRTNTSLCCVAVQTDIPNDETSFHIEQTEITESNMLAPQADPLLHEFVDMPSSNNTVDSIEQLISVTDAGKCLHTVETVDPYNVVSSECQTDDVLFEQYLHSIINQNEEFQKQTFDFKVGSETKDELVSEADTGLETLDSFSELDPISESTLIEGEFESCLSELYDEERLYPIAGHISMDSADEVDFHLHVGPVANIAAEMAKCDLDANQRANKTFAQHTDVSNLNDITNDVKDNTDLLVNVTDTHNSNGLVNDLSSEKTPTCQKPNSAEKRNRLPITMTSSSCQRDLTKATEVVDCETDKVTESLSEVSKEIESEIATKVISLEREYEEKLKDLETQIEDRLNKKLDFRERKVKLLEDNYEKKVKQIEYDVEERYEQLFRTREVEIILDAERDKIEHAKEVEQDAKRNIEQIKIEKDKQFVETMQKVRADISKQHRQEKALQHEKIQENSEGPGGDASSEALGNNIIDRLYQENQELAMARDALLQRIDMSQQYQQQVQEQLQSIMVDNEMETTQATPDIHVPSWLDWDLSPEFSFGSLTSSVDTKSLSGELDINCFCSKSDCLSIRTKYEQLVERIQKFQYAMMGDSLKSIMEKTQQPEKRDFDGADDEPVIVEDNQNKFIEHSEPEMQILERITSIHLEHSVRVPELEESASQVDKFVTETVSGKTTAEINSDILNQLITESSDQHDGHFSENVSDDEVSDTSGRIQPVEEDEVFSSVNSESKVGVLDSSVPPFRECRASVSNVEHGRFLEIDSDDGDNEYEKMFVKSHSDSETTGESKVGKYRRRRREKIDRHIQGHFLKDAFESDVNIVGELDNSESLPVVESKGVINNEVERPELKTLDFQEDRFVVEMSPVEERAPGSEEILLQKTKLLNTLGSDRGDFFVENNAPGIRYMPLLEKDNDIELDAPLLEKIMKTADSVESSHTDDTGYLSNRTNIDSCSTVGKDYFMEEKIDSGDILENIAQDISCESLPSLERVEKFIDQPKAEVLSESATVTTLQSETCQNSLSIKIDKFVSSCTCSDNLNLNELSPEKGPRTRSTQSYENTVFDVLNSICPGTNPAPCSDSDIVITTNKNFDNTVSDFSEVPVEDDTIVTEYGTKGNAELLSVYKRELQKCLENIEAVKEENNMLIEQNKEFEYKTAYLKETLQSENESLHCQLEKVCKENRDLVVKSEEMGVFREEQYKLKNRNDELCYNITELESKLQHFNEMETSKNNLKAEIVRLKLEIEDINHSLSAESVRSAKLCEQNAQNECALKELESMHLAVENLHAEIHILKDDKEWLEETMSEQKFEKQTLEQQNISVVRNLEDINKLKTSLEVLSLDYEKLKFENEALSNSVNRFSEMKEKLCVDKNEQEQLKHECTRLDSVNKVLEEDLQHGREENESLSTKLKRLEELLSSQETVKSKLKELVQEKQQLEETIFALNDENESISSKCNEEQKCFNDKLTKLSNENELLKERVAAHSCENEALSFQLNQTMEQFEEEVKKWSLEKESVEASVLNLSDKNTFLTAELKQALKSSEDKLSQLNHEKEQLEENIFLLSNKNVALLSELDQAKDIDDNNKSKLQSDIIALSGTNKPLNDELEKTIKGLEQTLFNVTQEKECLQETVFALSAKNDSLNADLTTTNRKIEDEIEKLQKYNTESLEMLNLEKEKSVGLIEEINKLGCDLDRLKQENASLKDQAIEDKVVVERLKGEKDKLNMTLSDMYKEISQLRHANNELDSQIKIKCDNINHLEQQFSSLKYEHVSLKQSNEKLKEINDENEWAIKELASQIECLKKDQSQLKVGVLSHSSEIENVVGNSPVTQDESTEPHSLEKSDDGETFNSLLILKDTINKLQQENVNLKTETDQNNESLKTETDKLKAQFKIAEAENIMKQELFQTEKTELLQMYSDLKHEVETLVVSKQELEDIIASLKIQLELEGTKEHDTSRELTLDDVQEMEELKSSISSLKQDIKDKDVYVRKLEEHLLNVDRGLPDLTSTPMPKACSGLPKVSKSFISKKSKFVDHSRKAFSLDRHDDFLLSSSMNQITESPMHKHYLDQIILSDEDVNENSRESSICSHERMSTSIDACSLTSPSSAGILDVSGGINYSLTREKDGHHALELKQYELVDEISHLKRDLRQTKAIYTQETALLSEDLEHEKALKKSMQSQTLMVNNPNSSQSLYDLKQSQEILRLRHIISPLKDENRRLNIENERGLNRIKDQEVIVLDLKERLSRNTSGIEEIEQVFGKQLALLQKQREELLDRLHDCELGASKLSIQLGEKSVMEDSLRREKEILIAKLDEKCDIETELHEKQLELEKQRIQQRHLEELVYQKDLNEQELMKQKRLLEQELLEIESKYRDREENLGYDKNQLLDELRMKNGRSKSQMSDSDDSRSVCSDSSGVSDRQIGRLEVMLEEVEKQHSKAVQVLRDQLKSKYDRRERRVQEQHTGALSSLRLEQSKQVQHK